MHRFLTLGAIGFLALLIVAACNGGGGTAAPTAGPMYTLEGEAAAGPTCPVEQAPPQSQCAARPVAGAVLVVTNAAGQEVARVTTDSSGAFKTAVPVGTYTITPQPVDGLMGVAPPVSVTVDANGGPGPIALEYDTGIR
jgi:hypothetical protein